VSQLQHLWTEIITEM